MEIILNAFLTNNKESHLVGALLGAGYINNHQAIFSDEIQKGQSISKKIDELIENHPKIAEAIDLLSPKARKFGVRIIRLYFEHFLAKNWGNYSKKPYDLYCQEVIQVLKNNNTLFPYKPKRIVNRVVKKKIITSLHTINGLNDYIEDMIRYNSYNSSIQESISDLVKHYNTYFKIFQEIFPLLQQEFALQKSELELSIAS